MKYGFVIPPSLNSIILSGSEKCLGAGYHGGCVLMISFLLNVYLNFSHTDNDTYERNWEKPIIE